MINIPDIIYIALFIGSILTGYGLSNYLSKAYDFKNRQLRARVIIPNTFWGGSLLWFISSFGVFINNFDIICISAALSIVGGILTLVSSIWTVELKKGELPTA